jgi:hypothetical protein
MSRDYIFQTVCPFCDKSHYVLAKEHQFSPFGTIRMRCDGDKIGHSGHRWADMRIVGSGRLRREFYKRMEEGVFCESTSLESLVD